MTDTHDLWWYRCCVCTQLWVWTRQNSSGAGTESFSHRFFRRWTWIIPGFNFEYVSGSFALLFLSKYAEVFQIPDTILLKQQEWTLSIFKIICSRRLPKNALEYCDNHEQRHTTGCSFPISSQTGCWFLIVSSFTQRHTCSWFVVWSSSSSRNCPRQRPLTGAHFALQGRSMLLAQLHRRLVKSFNILLRTSRKQR